MGKGGEEVARERASAEEGVREDNGRESFIS